MDVARYLDLFVQEASEQLEVLGNDLLLIERDGSTTALDSAFRQAHSLKGMAAAMGFGPITELSHGLEELLAHPRAKEGSLDASGIDAALAVTDALTKLVHEAAEGRPLDPEGTEVPFLVMRLREALLASSQPPGDRDCDRRNAEHHLHSKPGDSGDTGRSKDAVKTIRVRTTLMDGLMEGVGELLLTAERLRELVALERGEPTSPLADVMEQIGRTGKRLYHQVMAARMTALSNVTSRLPRVVREAARRTGREAVLETSGADIELDRSVLDAIETPLAHLLRNCVDHGIEPPSERVRAGKAAEGTIRLEARRDGDRVVLSLSDDGRGFDLSSIKARAVDIGLIDEALSSRISDSEAILLACVPGLSTAKEVTEVSGRGVGLDAVKSSIESLDGTFEIESCPGSGTVFTLSLPLTVAIQRLLLVAAGGELLALPVSKVVQVTRAPSEDGRLPTKIAVLDDMVETADLSAILGLKRAHHASIPFVVVEARPGQRRALAVDSLDGHIQGLVRPVKPPLDLLGAFSGVSLLPDGRPILVLDLNSLVSGMDRGGVLEATDE